MYLSADPKYSQVLLSMEPFVSNQPILDILSKCLFIKTPKTINCTALQCLPLRRKFMKCSIINPALSLLMKYLVIGQRQKALDFLAFHWSPHGSLVSIGQHFLTMRVVHLPKRTETSLITLLD